MAMDSIEELERDSDDENDAKMSQMDGNGTDENNGTGDNNNADGENGGHKGNNFGRIWIVTGPNQSGKSVFLRQCGVIAHLAHIGSVCVCYICVYDV